MVMTGLARAFALAFAVALCAGLAAADMGVELGGEMDVGAPAARPTGAPPAAMSRAVPGDGVVAERLSAQNAAGRSCVRGGQDCTFSPCCSGTCRQNGAGERLCRP